MAPNTKSSLIEKIGFSLTNLGNIPVMTVINTYLMIFYTDIVGVAPAAVGMLFLVSRVMDSFSDPIMGFIIDRAPKTKWGKYRPILAIGVVICCINFALLWFAPLMFEGAKIAAIWVTYLLLGITFDAMDVPLNSLIPVITRDKNDRNALSSIKGISYSVGSVLVNVGFPLIIAHYHNSLQGYQILVFVTIGIVLLLSLVGCVLVREHTIEAESEEAVEHEEYDLKGLLRIIAFRPVLIMFIAMLFLQTAWNMFNNTVIYYVIYVLNDAALLSNASIISLAGIVAAGVLMPFLVKRFGKVPMFIFSLVFMGSMLAMQVLSGPQVAIFFLAYLMLQAGRSLLNTMQYSLCADNVELVKDHMGIRGAAAIASLNSLTVKFGNGIGGAVAATVLGASCYIANQAQTPEALMGITIATFGIPFALYLLAAFVFKVGYKVPELPEKSNLMAEEAGASDAVILD